VAKGTRQVDGETAQEGAGASAEASGAERSADAHGEGTRGESDSTHRERPATIWQVAEAAGVSHQTVSRYLRSDPRMRPETKARVRRSIDELGYRPNLAARSMRTQRTQRLGVIVPDPIHQGMAVALGGAIDAAHGEGFSLQIFGADGDAAARTDRAREISRSGEVDGVLSFVPLLPRIHAESRGHAHVLVESDFDEHNRATGRLLDSSPVVEFVENLAELGHRRFLHISGDMEFGTARERRRLFVETVERLGLGPARVQEGSWDARVGFRAVMDLPDLEDPSRPTAVIAANDLVATGAVHAARDRGWSVPGDLSVTGWDDRDLGSQLEPTLTTVNTNHRELGRQAVEQLLAHLRGTDLPQDHTGLTKIIWRHSTGPAPA
jgi:DNA-binding LacI/PurR family transcriptional regulator